MKVEPWLWLVAVPEEWAWLVGFAGVGLNHREKGKRWPFRSW
jgi:hypothetical protein